MCPTLFTMLYPIFCESMTYWASLVIWLCAVCPLCVMLEPGKRKYLRLLTLNTPHNLHTSLPRVTGEVYFRLGNNVLAAKLITQAISKTSSRSMILKAVVRLKFGSGVRA